MSKYKAIQVGAGGFGISWLEILDRFEDIELVAVVDVNSENLKNAEGFLKNSSVEYFTDHLEAFSKVEADIAVIITPPQTHKKLALDALEHNLNVFMEKPIAHTFADALELLKKSEQYEKFIMISQNYRWRPEIEAIKKALNEGLIGKVNFVEWNFRRATKFGGWRDQYSEILIEDMSIHHFDLMRHILGVELSTIFAKSMKPSWSWFNGNSTASAIMNFDDILINYFGTWVTRGKETPWNGECKLVGEKGVIELMDDIPLVTYEDGTTEKLQVDPMKFEDREYSIYEMVQAMKENRKPVTDLADNIKSFAIVGAALESIKQAKEIQMDEFMGKA
ncbi:Gfo/Idh/MocA family oxidoreductase [Bacillus sp. FJAT-50079]|uniref:Gfo/Idh/MocA family protein n=1 Tax=Bacillus sp. FJAT-50079 TaxID=2833577 RepID=UPI001BC90C21|nr:Gfo/Idh/MocA family oxidoreductase [Bacillus sp. FJAT-50079]MBS4208655.1 Gfo/Idh/MocA family oxidoreductase [Bacillus sp. FJAT-50079]